MSVQWTVIAGYLYFEVAIVIILILPLFSPRRWNQFFKSRICSILKQHAAEYFYILLGVLGLFLIDAIREIRKYSSNTEAGSHINLSSEMKGSVKLFRAQRNFYITGFAIFLAFVIRRLISMLIIQDELSKKAEEIIKQAEAAVKHAKETVLAHTLEGAGDQKDEEIKSWKGKLEVAEQLLSQNRSRIQEMEIELDKWKGKFQDTKDTKDNEIQG